jgi:Bacterial lectin/Secretion system C-terminal sorting domain
MKTGLLLKRLFLFLVCAMAFRGHMHAQCSGGTAAGALTPAPAAGWQTMSITTGNYYTFTVPAATGCGFPTYFFSFCSGDGGSAGFDTQITILNSTGAFAGGYSDDACGLQSYVSWVPTAAGTYRVLLNTYFCGGGNGATLAFRMAPPPPPNAYFSLLNNAALGAAGCATLTTASNSQAGCAWDVDETLNMLAPFTRDFTIYLGNNDAGADGMAFVIQNAPLGRCVCGLLGGAMGAQGIPNSLIVEIDTYLNAEDRDDGMAGVLCTGGTEPDHLDIWLNGAINPPGASCPGAPGARIIPAAVRLMNGAADYNIENGLNHRLRVAWVPGSPGTLTVRIYDNAGLTLYGTVSHSFSPMTVFGTNTPFFGFTAATGGLNNEQSFCELPVVLPAEVLLTAQQAGTEVKLAWQATEGATVSRVDRSADGQAWKPLLTSPVAAQTVWQEGTDPAPQPGTNFYRVTMRNLDGQSTTSNVVEVRMDDQEEMTVSPNPSDGQFTIWFPHAWGAARIQLADLSGRIVYQGQSDQADAASVSTSGLAPGIYLLCVTGSGRTLHQRVVLR